MTRLFDALDGIADKAPEVAVPRGFYRRARRRRRWRAAASVAAVLALVALVVPVAQPMGRGGSRFGDGGSAGLPGELRKPAWSTATVADDPPGPASVVFDGDLPQADSEDVDLQWWRPGHTVYPSAVVGLHADTYRIVRSAYSSGTELSPDGRYLLTGDHQVVDLVTGKSRTVRVPGTAGTVAGAWSADGARILYVVDRVTTVVAWPSLDVVSRFPHPDQAPVEQDVALSPDGSMLAVHSNGRVVVYRPDGSQVWSTSEDLTTNITYSDLGRVRIGGRAAWRPDGKLFFFGRNELTCDDCGSHPGTWKIEVADGLVDNGPPGFVTANSYPVLRSVLDARIVAWRGTVAYAVVVWSHKGTGEPGRVGLIRMRPGEGAFEWVLEAPSGTTSMQVATEHVDRRRPTGEPRFGLNRREVFGEASKVLCALPVLAVVVALAFMARNDRRRRRGI